MSNENKKRYEQYVKIINKELGAPPSSLKTVRRQYAKAKNEEEERQKKARKSMNEKKKKTVKPRNSCSICSQFVTSTPKTKKNNKKNNKK
tara:strand:+ start:50 stop:319 length:270 start_codon:yes stop_codon:yes gene_type:complete